MVPICIRTTPFANLFNICKNAVITYPRMRMSSNSRTPKTGLRSTLKLGALGLGVGTIVGTGYTLHQKNKPRGHIVNEQSTIETLEAIPRTEPTRKIRIAGDRTGLKLTIYQYQNCPFCCKVRAFLDYYGISYDVVEVDPLLRQSVKWSEYKKVPIVVAQVEGGYQPLNDSSMIISALASYLQNRDGDLKDIAKSYPILNYLDENGSAKSEIMNRYFLMLDERDTERVKEERKWRKWTDDVLVHTLSPNIYRTWDEALKTMHWFSKNGEWDKHFPAWEKNLMIYTGSFSMLVIGKRLKKRHNLKDDVRQSLYDDCNYFTKALAAKGTQFLGGSSPNLADLSVYGVLSSIEGCDAFTDLLNYSKIKNWYFSMKDMVTNHRGGAFTEMAAHN